MPECADWATRGRRHARARCWRGPYLRRTHHLACLGTHTESGRVQASRGPDRKRSGGASPTSKMVRSRVRRRPAGHSGPSPPALRSQSSPRSPSAPRREQSSHKTFNTKRTLAKKQKQNRPIPQWIRLRTDNKIKCVAPPPLCPARARRAMARRCARARARAERESGGWGGVAARSRPSRGSQDRAPRDAVLSIRCLTRMPSVRLPPSQVEREAPSLAAHQAWPLNRASAAVAGARVAARS